MLIRYFSANNQRAYTLTFGQRTHRLAKVILLIVFRVSFYNLRKSFNQIQVLISSL
ncbi:hypothetical protein PL9214291400 [Planktothrix tepida PCC 9214]|uniref:Uncharacterized protein n=1 Tax=Planktothrix tepida PCC 9214 TaxID=671072 RepID=A0A1J1LGZ7_9CYAN|nr:hypothetical protein PL9214291400 [Planktothrix tepida PCC 9214]